MLRDDDINKNLSKEEYQKLQLELNRNRRIRYYIMFYLLLAIIISFIFGTIENPFEFTLSQMGNRFDNLHWWLFLTWSFYVAFSLYITVAALHRLEKYKSRTEIIFVLIAGIFLVLTALIPSVPEKPIESGIHVFTAILFALFITLGIYPFVKRVAKENPRLNRNINIWLSITWGGGVFWVLLLGNKGMYELWFVVSLLFFLLYISFHLYEEYVIKVSVKMLKNEEDLNEGVEKILYDMRLVEQEKKKAKRLKTKKEK